MNTLQVVAKDIYKRAKRMKDSGEMPLVLGVDGLVALVWDRFQRYMKKKEGLELLDTAALALLVYHASQAPELANLADMTWDDDQEEDPPTQEVSEHTIPLCPHCEEVDKVCTIIPDATLPICDDCVESFDSPESYQKWAQEYLQQEQGSSVADDIEQ